MPFPKDRTINQSGPTPNQDQRYASLVKFIKWQGRIVVLLAVALVAVFLLRKVDIHLPTQEPTKEAPPLTQNALQYSVWAYQDNQNLGPGTTVNRPNLTIMGQIYDFKEAQAKWPNLSIAVNNARIVPSSYGNFQLEMTLRPGNNIINSSLILDGKPVDSQQLTIFYTPSSTPDLTTPEDISVHAQL